MKPHLDEAALSEHGLQAPLTVAQVADLNPCAVLLRYDDAEIEVENISRTELGPMVTLVRAWAEDVFQIARSAEAVS